MDDNFTNAYVLHRGSTNWRPQYHFTAPSAWINDPNGLIYFQGWYHLFYQHNPKSCEWGPMHWGHAVSRDMLHWKDMPIALEPDQPYDTHPEGGCFSGCAVEKDGILHLIYTATVKRNGKTVQTQCLALSEDGIHFRKYEGNPIISAPPTEIEEDFRDPKVFQVNGKWYMVVGGSVGGADYGGDGRIVMYESDDLYHWEYRGVILASGGRLGSMFECPDMFPLRDKWILTCSPMNHPEYNKAMYCVGTMDFENCRYQIEYLGNLDFGFDYYAPQSFLDAESNRVLIAWQNEWLWMPWSRGWGPTGKENWLGTLSIPRTASLGDDGRLKLFPISQIKTLKVQETVEKEILIDSKGYDIRVQNPRCFYLKLRFQAEKMPSRYLQIGLLGKGERVCVLHLDLVGMVMTLDRDKADDYQSGRMNCIYRPQGKETELEIYVDHSSVELYVDHGVCCMAANIYSDEDQTGCWIRTPYKEAVLDTLEYGSMKSVWE